MGVVYRAVDTRLGRAVALKFLAPRLHADARARDRLLQEARAVAALDHPHVASVYDVGETPEGRLYLAMAYYEGETLAERVARGPLDAAEAVGLALQVARGLAAAHRAGVVHRDVKPANVMVLPEGGPDGGPCAKLLDFGIARVDDAALTQAGESLGTALYMSPEQARGATADARSDVWGVGVVLYEVLAGRRPFDGAVPAAAAYAVLHEAPTPLAEVRDGLPPGLVAVVERCLAKDPAGRYPSMDALVEALAGVRQGRGVSPAAAPAEAASVAPSGLRRWAAGALAAVVAAVALVFAWTALRPAEAVAEPQRLAVLPFSDLGGEAGPLSTGLVETVTAKLAQLAPLRAHVRVVPASEVEAGLTPSEARERFGATLVVEGTVQAEGGRVRVTLSLVDVGGDAPSTLGSREVDDASGSAFALQDAAVLQVADLLRVEVGVETQQTLAAGGTDDPEANERYLRGRGELRDQQGAADLARARTLFEEALALDSTFALARAGLAEAEWQTYRTTADVAWADRALADAQRALALDDGLPEVHVVLGTIHEGRGEYGLALAALDRALALDPGHAEATRWLARVYAAQGRDAEAEATFRRAIRLAPDYWLPYNTFGSYHLRAGRAAEAADQFRQGLALAPDHLTLLYNLGVAASQADDVEAAEAAWERVTRLDPTHVRALGALLSTRFTLGDFEGAVAAGERAVAIQPDDYDLRLSLAEARRWAPGQRPRAAADYRAAIDLARDHLAVARTPEVLLRIGSAYAALGRADSARAYLDEVVAQLSPDDADVHDAYNLAVAYEIVGDRERALVWLRSALGRGYGRAKADRSPWLRDLRASGAYRTLTSP